MIELTFWFSFIVLVYVQVGYFLILRIVNIFKHSSEKPVEKEYIPPVSIIMVALNEQDNVAKWFQRIAQLDYPKEMLEIIVVSDGSTDNTVAEARRFQSGNVTITSFEKNRGKALCHNDVIPAAKNEIIVLTDAGTEFSPEVVKQLVHHMSDPKVGAVIGRMQYRKKDDSTSTFESSYWKYETAIRIEENRLGILSVGMGPCYCIRKSLFTPLAAGQDVDNVYALYAIKKGYRIVYESRALVTDSAPSSVNSEFRSRIRIASRSLRDNLESWSLNDCIKHPLITWGLVSHRILRWMTPFFLFWFCASNILLLEKSPYLWIFELQVMFFLFAIIGGLAEIFNKRIPVASQAYLFIVANIGIGIGVLKALFGRPPATWSPTR